MRKRMAKSQSDKASFYTSVVDYDSEHDEEVADSRKLATANVSLKRSSQAEMPVPSSQSDSGYSSRTQATAASADSMESVTAKAAKMASHQQESSTSDNVAPGPSNRRRTTNDRSSERRETQRGPERAAPTKVKKVVKECVDPNCNDERCKGRKVRPRVDTSTEPPNMSPVKISSTTSSRTPRQSEYPQRPKATPLVIPQGRRSRPTSMYELQPHMMMPPPIAGPSPTIYGNRAGYTFSGPSPVGYGPGPIAIIERPGLATRRTDMSARAPRPVSIHGTQGLVSYNANANKTLSARRPTQASIQAPAQAPAPPPAAPLRIPYHVELDDEEDEDEEEYSEEEEESEDDEDDEEEAEADEGAAYAEYLRQQHLDDTQRKLQAARLQQAQTRERQRQMLPPNLPASAAATGGKPAISMRKAGPAPQITYGRRPSEDQSIEAEMQRFREQTQAAVGSSQLRRPSLLSRGGPKATTYSHPRSADNERITVEGRNRRMSYQGSENPQRLADMHSRFQQSTADPMDFNQIIEDVVSQKLHELRLQPADSATYQVNLDSKLRDAMAHQHRTDQAAPLGRDKLGELPQLTKSALRRKTGLPSRTGSSRSNRSSEEDSRISAGHRITTGSELGNVTVNGDEMKMRIDTSSVFEMEFEGRRITIAPTYDGSTAELIIGGKRESSYVSTRGSNATRSQVGNRVTRTPSQRDQRLREREREQKDRERELRDRRDRQDRDRARFNVDVDDDDDDNDNDRRSARGSARPRAETYDSQYQRSGQMRRETSRDGRYARPNDYPQSSSYTRPSYYAPGYGSAKPKNEFFGG
ncbi:hypothetical protein EJ08DRAFT_180470 [Tothia fuscella]|uniref:Uncharacterized protein n=1 Tax=Tothia fuscella TaxID=1048955 RepID=A0A9P4NTR9_9PEZI|nr:hypothetical protein EJ08DRAFT_180470 [Tothia fuscella]